MSVDSVDPLYYILRTSQRFQGSKEQFNCWSLLLSPSCWEGSVDTHLEMVNKQTDEGHGQFCENQRGGEGGVNYVLRYHRPWRAASLAWSVEDRRNVSNRILHLLVFGNSNCKVGASHTAMTMTDLQTNRNKTHTGLVYFLKQIFCPCHSVVRVDMSASSAIICSDQKLTNDINSVLFLSILFVRSWVSNHI